MNKILFFLAVLVSPCLVAECFDVTVKVNKTMSDGAKWDFYGKAPDVKVCFYDQWGQRCKAKGEGNNFSKPYCRDSFICNLGTIHFEGDTVTVDITDVDRYRFDNPIDFGECVVGKPCILGNAELHFKKTLCK